MALWLQNRTISPKIKKIAKYGFLHAASFEPVRAGGWNKPFVLKYNY